MPLGIVLNLCKLQEATVETPHRAQHLVVRHHHVPEILLEAAARLKKLFFRIEHIQQRALTNPFFVPHPFERGKSE